MDLPGADGRPDSPVGMADPVVIGEHFVEYQGVPGSDVGSWPRFRGVTQGNTIETGYRLRLGGPLETLWTIALGEGHAGPAVYNGRVYVLDYLEEEQGDALRCFSLDTGEEIWRRWYAVKTKRNHGMSRTIPAVTDDFVVTIGPQCHVMCVDSANGDLLWSMDLAREFGAEVPLWYTGQCPLIDGSTAVLAVGGDALLIGVDCATGAILWRVPNPNGYRMSHSSVMEMELLGKRTYVYSAIGAIAGVSAEKADVGSLLWLTEDFDATVIAPSPVSLGDGRIFSTAGYGAGSIMLQIGVSGGVFEVETLSRFRPKDGFSCEQQTPLVYDGYLFGILTKDAGPLRGQFVCYDPDGGIVWASGEDNRFGLGPYLMVDDTFFILSDDGMLTQIEAQVDAYKEIGQLRILDGVDTWAPPAVVDGKLIARDSTTMVCIDLRS